MVDGARRTRKNVSWLFIDCSVLWFRFELSQWHWQNNWEILWFLAFVWQILFYATQVFSFFSFFRGRIEFYLDILPFFYSDLFQNSKCMGLRCRAHHTNIASLPEWLEDRAQMKKKWITGMQTHRILLNEWLPRTPTKRQWNQRQQRI